MSSGTEDWSNSERDVAPVIRESDNLNFALLSSNLFPGQSELLSREAIDRAQELFDQADLNLSPVERKQLFHQALEYYSQPLPAEKPLWHSCNSYVLRKALEEGFSGGHGRYAGESSRTDKQLDSHQRGLSVTHPGHPSAESFQQMFARLSVSEEDLPNLLTVDSERLTGESVVEVWTKELLSLSTNDEIRTMYAKNQRLEPTQITDELVAEIRADEALRKGYIAKVESSGSQSPKVELIQREVLPQITDSRLRDELAFEAEHPFPCIVTFEAAGHEQDLTTISRGEYPTHIIFEDFFWGNFPPSAIREIRVPQQQIEKVRGWMADKNPQVKIVPIELYEVKRFIQENAHR